LERTTIAEAAKKLGVTQEAIRARVKRGTIEHEKGEDGKTYVYLHGVASHAQPDPNAVPNGMVNDYIEALKGEIKRLEHDREEWKEEARRKDTIIAQMNQSLGAMIQRIPELEASPDERESTITATEEQSKGGGGEDQKPQSWWQRPFAP
jgi:hypothetical protein